ncbi:MAG: hypothetical protein DRO94_04480 [Candidatus Altiarchaeales archaeon]|nr:MAG: hypothetical protein DRO95_04755 [Candidatus Altiarchaeales archaeon]RLI93750.1 MAG: hypothetical protein DRO94_04480 [Candidatus Altiarchaeales archaeon]
MNEIIELISDFDKLDEYIRNSNLRYREAIINFYKELGEKLGFTVRESTSIIKHGVNFGKIDLIWVEPNITFTVEFGNFDNLLGHLFRILEFSPNLAVLVLSSNSSIRIENVSNLIHRSRLIENMREKIIILDVGAKKVLN